ncbi:uncharacterized protein [Magallana gigas]|uniref:uncharacterized protein n=1 Tax=Magallana gigas TaxID=29159 RepID=UPI00334004C6
MPGSILAPWSFLIDGPKPLHIQSALLTQQVNHRARLRVREWLKVRQSRQTRVLKALLTQQVNHRARLRVREWLKVRQSRQTRVLKALLKTEQMVLIV